MAVEYTLNSFFASRIALAENPDGRKAEKFAGVTSEFGFSPVGVISYAENTRLALVAESLQDHTLHTQFLEYEGFNPQSLIGGHGRILNLPHISELMPAQLPAQSVQIKSFRSLSSLPSLGVSINIVDPFTQEMVSSGIDEFNLLSAIAGIHGGIAIFQGNNRREDTALVVEGVHPLSTRGSASFAGILFFHPEEDVLDSVSGLAEFFRSFNSAMRRDVGLSRSQQKVEESLDWLFKEESKSPDAKIKRQIFLAKALAAARLFDRFGVEETKGVLDLATSFRPNMFAKMIAKLIPFKPESANLADEVAASYLTLINNHRITQQPALPDPSSQKQLEAPKEPEYLSRLNTKDAKLLRESLPEDLADSTEAAVLKYMQEVLSLANESKSREGLDDLMKLVKELKSSKWSDNGYKTYYFIGLNDDKTFGQISLSNHQNEQLVWIMEALKDLISTRIVSLYNKQ